MSKTSVWKVPLDHFKTLYNNQGIRSTDGTQSKRDWPSIIIQTVVPFSLGLIAWYSGARFFDVNAAVAGISIVAGLLISMAVLLFQLRISINEDSRLGPGDFTLLDETMANTLWAILWGVFLALYLIVSAAGNWISSDKYGPILTGIAVAGAAHFLLVIAMCLKRLRGAYERFAMKL